MTQWPVYETIGLPANGGRTCNRSSFQGTAMHSSRLAFLLLVVVITVSSDAVMSQAETGDFRDSGYVVAGDGLMSILDGIHAKRQGDFTQRALKVQVLRTDVVPFRVYSEKAFRKAGAQAGGSYAIISHLNCRSEVDQERYEGGKTNWYMFEKDKLIAYDNNIFAWRCVVSNQFRPAPITQGETELKLRGWVAKNFPKGVFHRVVAYKQGVRYARIGRVEDAESSLAEGDARFQGSNDHIVRREGRRTIRISDEEDAQRWRKRLVKEIAAAHERIAGGHAHFIDQETNFPSSHSEETEQDRKQTAGDIARRDQEEHERWEREKDSRLFVEVKGGWVRVEGWRLRQGPREGERFLTYSEMMELEAERKAKGK